jgi:hypothetical protein
MGISSTACEKMDGHNQHISTVDNESVAGILENRNFNTERLETKP